MKITLKDWIITALAYVVIGTLLYAVNHDDDGNPNTNAAQAHSSSNVYSSVQAAHRAKHKQVASAAPTSSALAAATPTMSAPSSSSTASSNPFVRVSHDQASLQRLTQEASQMTGITASAR